MPGARKVLGRRQRLALRVADGQDLGKRNHFSATWNGTPLSARKIIWRSLEMQGYLDWPDDTDPTITQAGRDKLEQIYGPRRCPQGQPRGEVEPPSEALRYARGYLRIEAARMCPEHRSILKQYMGWGATEAELNRRIDTVPEHVAVRSVALVEELKKLPDGPLTGKQTDEIVATAAHHFIAWQQRNMNPPGDQPIDGMDDPEPEKQLEMNL